MPFRAQENLLITYKDFSAKEGTEADDGAKVDRYAKRLDGSM